MGYACPVCETPQADARHLANHLAFTALLGEDDHESWLSEYAPGWDEAGADELAGRVVEEAEEVEFPQVFEDTTDHHHDRAHDEPHDGDRFEDEPPLGGRAYGGELDAETAAAIERARELTEDDNG